jgi:predicted peroxiredoxin
MTDAFYGPRSQANAQALLMAAAELGYDVRVVRTTLSGYLVPEAVLERVKGLDGIQEGVTYPEPSRAPERPRGNASLAVWADYARALGVEVTDEDNRDGLIAKVDALNEKETD